MDFHFTGHPEAVDSVRAAAQPQPGPSVRRAAGRWWSGQGWDNRHQQRPPSDEPFFRRFVPSISPARISDHTR